MLLLFVFQKVRSYEYSISLRYTSISIIMFELNLLFKWTYFVSLNYNNLSSSIINEIESL